MVEGADGPIGDDLAGAPATCPEGWGEKPPVKNGPSVSGYGAVAMSAALRASMTMLPEHLRKTLAWDHGRELPSHA